MGNYVLIYFGFKIKYNLFTIYKRVKQMNEYTSLCFLLLKSVKQLSKPIISSNIYSEVIKSHYHGDKVYSYIKYWICYIITNLKFLNKSDK